MAGLTLDAGPLIAWERGSVAMVALLDEATAARRSLTVPAVVVAEVWRGGPRSARLARLLRTCRVEPVDEGLARVAGALLAASRSSQTVDALVVATARRRGEAVLTADLNDVMPLADVAGVDVRSL